MKLKFNKFYLIFYLYRCLYSILGQTFIAGLTILGDSERYQTASLADSFTWELLIDETQFTDFIGALFSTFFLENVFLINIGFQTLGFLGIYKFLKSLDLKERRYLLPIIFSPSFTLWSSVASKESIILLAVGLVCAYITDIYKKRAQLKWYYWVAFYLILLFKPQFLISLSLIIATTKLTSYFISKDKLWIAIFPPLLSLVPLYIFSDKIIEFSFQIEAHFAIGESSRTAFWVDTYDIFDKAFEGMFLAFTGPTLDEVISTSSFLFIISFIESSCLLLYLIFLIVIRQPFKISLQRYAIGISSLLWLMFPAYPAGVINPGSAIRYRTNYILIIFLIVTVILSHDSKINRKITNIMRFKKAKI